MPSADRIQTLQAELAALKQQRKAEKQASKIQSTWLKAEKRLPDESTLRAVVWVDGQMDRAWFRNGQWFSYDGTFFLTEKDKLENVSYWMPIDWLTSRSWPAYGPGLKNRLRYLWQRLSYGAQDIAFDFRPAGWGKQAQLAKKVTFYRDPSGRILTGMPEWVPTPRGLDRIVCGTALEAERYSSLQRRQEQVDHRYQQESRGAIEEAQREEIRSERRELIKNARNAVNRDFLIAANERFDRQHKPWQYEKESYLHSEAFEDRR